MTMPAPELVWGAFTRLIGVIYLIAFASLLGQTTTLAGDGGIAPVRLKLAAMRRDFPGVRRFVYFPTLLWIACGNRAIRSFIGLGIAGALAIIYGGALSFWGLLICYLVFLSLDCALVLAFPWECALFEAGILALFLPATLALPELAASAAPPAALAWAYRLLLFRVVFGFGKFKFTGSSWRDLSYLQGFLINQPLPTMIAWYAHRLPLWALRLGVVMLFCVEIPGAFMTLVPGAIGLSGGAGILGLMLVIHLCGNFGYFNVIIAVLCVTLLDSETPRTLDLPSLFASDGPWLTNAFVLLHTLGALAYLPFNSYVSQNWHRWAVLLKVRPRILLVPVRVLSALAPLRWLHAYGVFPPKSMAPVRNVAVVEISYDGESWHELEYTRAATQPKHRPRFIAPHMARWDQLLIYESYGTTAHALAYSVANFGMPYGHAPFSDAECLLQRILEGHFYEGVIFEKGSFARPDPPKLARMRVFMLRPTKPAELRETGRWWHRELMGPHYPARALKPFFWQLWLPEPELFDLDDVIWKRRSVLGRMMKSAVRAKSRDEFRALLADETKAGPGISPADLERFWSEFLDAIDSAHAADWSRISELAGSLRARYSSLELRLFERIAGRISTALEARLEPYFLGDRKPALDLPSHYHFALFTQHLIVQGRPKVESVWERPELASEDVAEFTLQSGMYLSVMFRLERLSWEAHKIRLLDCVLARASERFPDSGRARYEKALEATAMKLWGVAYLTPFLRERFQEPELSDGTPERYPEFIERSTGEIVLADEAEGSRSASR